MFLSWRISCRRTIADRALIRWQALAIVGGTAMRFCAGHIAQSESISDLRPPWLLGLFGLTIFGQRARVRALCRAGA